MNEYFCKERSNVLGISFLSLISFLEFSSKFCDESFMFCHVDLIVDTFHDKESDG